MPNYNTWTANFKRLNNEFAVLRNVRLVLRDSDGDFADLKLLGITKRPGTAPEGQQINASGSIHSQLYYRNKTTNYHLAANQGTLYRKLTATLTDAAGIGSTTLTVSSTTGFPASGTLSIGGDLCTYTGVTATTFTGVTGIEVAHTIGDTASQWSVVQSGLTSGKTIDGIAVTSYGGSAMTSGTCEKEITRSWSSAESYSSAALTTTFTDSSGNFPTDDSLIGWQLYPNTSDAAYAGKVFSIISHTGTTITVAGDTSASGAYNGKTYKIKPPQPSVTLLDTGANWTTDQYVGHTVVITGGTGLGQSRRIASNERSYLIVSLAWDVDPDGTSTYSIYDKANDDNVLFLGNGYDALKKYTGSGAPTDLANRPKGNILDVYNERLIVTGDPVNQYTLYYSQIGNPEYFPATNVIRPKGFDIISGHAVWNDKGIILKERSIWAYTFTSSGSVALDEVPSATGCISRNAITEVEGEIWYFDGKEIQSLGAAENQIGVLRTKSVSFPINNLLADLTQAQARSATMTNDGKYVRFSVPDANLMFEYDIRYSTWTTITGISAASFLVDQDVHWYYGDSTTGTVYRMDIAGHYADGGVPGRAAGSGGRAINTVVASKGLDFGSRSIYKIFRFVDYEFENQAGSFEYNVTIYTSKHKLVYSKQLSIGQNIDEQATEFGTAAFGDALFGGSNPAINTFTRRVSVGRDAGKFAILSATNNRVDESFTLIGLSAQWFPKTLNYYPSELIS